MRKSVFDPQIQAEIAQRLDKITPETQPRWGIMKPNQMLRHLVESAAIITGDLQLPDKSTFMTRTFMRLMVLGAKIPPRKMLEKNPPMTFLEVDVVKSGIQVNDFASEKTAFQKMVSDFVGGQKFAERHPLFGKMKKKHWGQFLYGHINYHFTQFGV